MSLDHNIINLTIQAVKELFNTEVSDADVQLQETRKEFKGERTIVVFPFVRFAKKSPEKTGEAIGDYLLREIDEVVGYNVIKGFLNLEIANSYWIKQLNEALDQDVFGYALPGSKPLIVVEYSSPNTNKPLHLGHLRNNFLGYSVAEIAKAAGHDVKKVQIINDRGIHICKSMLAWEKFGDGETPENSGLKGDHLVGKYYVIFDKKYKEQINALVAEGMAREEAEKEAPLIREAREMLQKWEAKDPQVYALWEKMNGWVYSGFGQTYTAMGVDFDKLYYESNTWLLGKDEVQKGLEKGVFYKRQDGSVWADLSADGLDEKLLLRSDGTTVYMTQDLGTAILRYRDFPQMAKMVYTVGNEQEYHFKVLFLILEKLGFDWAKECVHLSYGMVELPEGKMKSREGTVVDADDLMQEMTDTARNITEELGKLDGIPQAEKEELYKMIGMASLKYFLLKVDPKKNMTFDPQASIDFNGNTGSFIQYTHARIQSILRNADTGEFVAPEQVEMNELEKNLLVKFQRYPAVITEAAEAYNPGIIANYVYDLVKDFNSFYQSCPILKAADPKQVSFRLALSALTGRVIASAMKLLGIQVPERM